jgi:ABC-type dipeptide/oligopeptide/nickel transport system ATPase component
MLLITHDLSLALRTSDTLAVMHEGRIVEQGTASKLRQSAEHPYTRQLFDSIPSLHGAGAHNSKDGG